MPQYTAQPGYTSREYALSLAEFGEVVTLPRSGGSVLAAPVPGTALRDLAGCYPLFDCRDWSALAADLHDLADEFVSVRLVTDPFGHFSSYDLQLAFPQVCYEYKQHFATDLSLDLSDVIDSNHRRNLRKALASLEVRDTTTDPSALAVWLPLYDELVQRHKIQGIASFSPQSFAKQFGVPGFRSFTAFHNGSPCGMTLWYVARDVAYYHLAAYNNTGYEHSASFALFWHALQQFRDAGLRWAALGAGAGTAANESGLTRFKRGWATHSRPVYFCGRVLQPSVYAELAVGKAPASGYFPVYRAA